MERLPSNFSYSEYENVPNTASNSNPLLWFFIFIFICIVGFAVYLYLSKQPLPTQNNITSDTTSNTTSNISSPPELTKNEVDAKHENSYSENDYNDSVITTALNDASQFANTPIADDSYSNIQSNKSVSKTGWCYIGEERGYRSCVQVGENDKCMSGDIFPTKDICVNPSLRE